MVRLKIVPSPHPEVIVSPSDEAAFPEFRPLLEGTEAPRHDPSQTSTVVVLENKSGRAITALRYRWVMVDASGTPRTSHTWIDIYRYHENEGSSRTPAVESGARKIIRYRMTEDARTAAVRLGLAATVPVANKWEPPEAIERTFSIDLIVFADGEICGPDPDHYGLELLSRKHVAEFVARQVRLAVAENRDVTPVLNALCMIPGWPSMDLVRLDEPVLRNTKHFVGLYLALTRGLGDVATLREAALRHLENQPAPPEFYRRDDCR